MQKEKGTAATASIQQKVSSQWQLFMNGLSANRELAESQSTVVLPRCLAEVANRNARQPAEGVT